MAVVRGRRREEKLVVVVRGWRLKVMALEKAGHAGVAGTEWKQEAVCVCVWLH